MFHPDRRAIAAMLEARIKIACAFYRSSGNVSMLVYVFRALGVKALVSAAMERPKM